MHEELFHRLLVRIEKLALEHRVEFAVQPEVEQPVEWILAPGASERRDILADQRLVLGAGHGQDALLLEAVVREAVGYRAAFRLRLHSRAERWVGEHTAKRFRAFGFNRRVPGDERLKRVRMR